MRDMTISTNNEKEAGRSNDWKWLIELVEKEFWFCKEANVPVGAEAVFAVFEEGKGGEGGTTEIDND